LPYDPQAFIRSRGVERVLISHHHEDHAGNANRIISELPDVAVYAAPETIHYLSKGFEIQLYRRIFWGVPKAKCSPQVRTLIPLMHTILFLAWRIIACA
jgi:glyoxylase-like metal-dependent hydrolase (beta-lactamase superfamily II)